MKDHREALTWPVRTHVIYCSRLRGSSRWVATPKVAETIPTASLRLPWASEGAIRALKTLRTAEAAQHRQGPRPEAEDCGWAERRVRHRRPWMAGHQRPPGRDREQGVGHPVPDARGRNLAESVAGKRRGHRKLPAVAHHQQVHRFPDGKSPHMPYQGQCRGGCNTVDADDVVSDL